MKSIVIIWLIFAGLYLTLGIMHLSVRNEKVPHVGIGSTNGIKPVRGLNDFIDGYNSGISLYSNTAGRFNATAKACFLV